MASMTSTAAAAAFTVAAAAPAKATQQAQPRMGAVAAPGARMPSFVGLRKDRKVALVARSPSNTTVAARRFVTSATAAVEALPTVDRETAEKAINAIRFLAIDAVEKAKSGHPGLPMGCAPMSYVLWKDFMKLNPKDPKWADRDRFVLSAGHGSMLQYALLHLFGYDSVTIEDIKQFRQWGSKTPGHPENFITAGIEVTTGPLGQGIANAVGLAAAEKHLAARFNKPGYEIVDHYTYTILGDGCNMEGISNEAASLAGHWGLGKLIALYDDNTISIDGRTEISFTEDVSARFESLGWHTIHVKDGNTDIDAIKAAIEEAKAVTDKPTMIKISTIIGYGSPNKADSYASHGAALGEKEVQLTREKLGWPYEPFVVPEEVYAVTRDAKIKEGAELEAKWNALFESYKKEYPTEAAEFEGIAITGKIPDGWADALPKYTPEDKGDATRNLSQQCLNALAPVVPGLLGGSADLASSNMTLLKMFGNFQKNTPAERNVRFGVREHAMGAISNGFAHHSPGLVPYCATFFVFTDYMRSAMRTSALAEVGVLYVMTHDSIGLGEDGPTHQPVEHLASFRAMPNILTLRPGDGNETAGAYKIAIENRERPSLLVLSRQAMRHLPGTSVEGVAKGGYVISDSEDGAPEVIIIGTGTELEMAEDAGLKLRAEGIKTRVVSFVCWELFFEQSQEYRDSVLPPSVTARVSIEAGSTFGWERIVGTAGKAIGVDTFGASAPAPILYKEFGITVDAVVTAAKSLLGK